ncbi:N-acetylgalactosaminyltransferase 7-like isoform X1 [Haliotis rufescens]|uniref:N-acetylgalactosaminyltransferase 7-like isoform X1 n=2 Tax=Haliotis rufescens TaxID=6454 RepID=UPI001EB06EE3|nr:N-acetylgalactosaminyltransferase 7-like isoform X1 [Haliotis rufescens]
MKRANRRGVSSHQFGSGDPAAAAAGEDKSFPMRVYCRRKLLLKLGLAVTALLLVGPYLFHLFDDNKGVARRQDKFVHEMNQKDSKRQHKSDHAVPDLNQDNVIPQPQVGEDDNPFEHKNLGPVAVMKKGITGNFEPKEPEAKNTPGEMGEPVYTTMEEQSKADQTVREFGFNMVASDKIPMDRSIPDTRMDECKYWHYPTDLPTVSVILVFHNEGWSTLVRTVHSVIDTSPPHLLKEVVMVDDYSDKEHLKGKLEDYVKQFNGKVKLYRNEDREGLIRTRTRGAELSTGDVILFLDAHCECNRNWLVPLLTRIRHDRTVMAVPIVDGIDWNNFRYHPVYTTNHHRGIFEWGFLYKESQVPQKELSKRAYNSEPYKSPTHAGGLFAMDRKYFFEIGAYDPGMQIWGGENFELSFKIWQCGGSIEWVPCSRVGHVYRNHMPYSFGKISHKIPVINLNYMRVVEVWLDPEFREYFYTREPTIRGYPVGDLTKQVAFKKEKKCRSFKWFMENVAYEVYDRFPPPPPNKAWGEFKEKQGTRCWDTVGQGVNGGPIGVYYCHHGGGNQLYRLNTKGQIGYGERCIESPNGDTLHIHYCDVQPTGPWDYDENSYLIKNILLSKCVEIGKDERLHLQPCDPASKSQQFIVNEIFPWKDKR